MTVVRQRLHKHPPLKLALPPPADLLLRPLPPPAPPAPSSLSPDSPAIDSPSELEKLSVLGHGTGGTVYKVRHRRTGKIYAIKTVRSDQDVMVFLHEAEILGRVRSPFVVRCHGIIDVGSSPGSDLSFLMEYMDHGSLHGLIGKCERVPESVISDVASRVLQGLHYLHSMQIVHWDIKPSNLLINSKGEVKIADFGVSRVGAGAVDPDAGDDSYAGTCAYMSPERFDVDRWGGGAAVDGFPGDVWALGVVVLECYLGRFPLVGPGQRPDWATLMCAICYGESPKVPETASPEFGDFVGRCLEKDWRRRATLAELLDHPFVRTGSGGRDERSIEKCWNVPS